MADIVERLNEACVGHPHAKIAWPHRLLHDARDEIERLRAALIAIRDTPDAWQHNVIANDALGEPAAAKSEEPK